MNRNRFVIEVVAGALGFLLLLLFCGGVLLILDEVVQWL